MRLEGNWTDHISKTSRGGSDRISSLGLAQTRSTEGLQIIEVVAWPGLPVSLLEQSFRSSLSVLEVTDRGRKARAKPTFEPQTRGHLRDVVGDTKLVCSLLALGFMLCRISPTLVSRHSFATRPIDFNRRGNFHAQLPSLLVDNISPLSQHSLFVGHFRLLAIHKFGCSISVKAKTRRGRSLATRIPLSD